MTGLKNRDLIDRIADGLPESARATFYREMMYCRSLPENDELLRVLRVMQVLTLLMERVPERVVTERERLEQVLAGFLKDLQRCFQASESSRAKLDQRLVQLPGFIAAGISPETIVAEINEKLENEFARSTIPETSARLAKTAEQIGEVTRELDIAITRMSNSYSGAAEKAHTTIEKLDKAISNAAETAGREAKRLSTGFHQQYWWSVFLLTSVALFIGIFAGMLLMHAYDHPSQKPERPGIPIIQSPPPVKAKSRK